MASEFKSITATDQASELIQKGDSAKDLAPLLRFNSNPCEDVPRISEITIITTFATALHHMDEVCDALEESNESASIHNSFLSGILRLLQKLEADDGSNPVVVDNEDLDAINGNMNLGDLIASGPIGLFESLGTFLLKRAINASPAVTLDMVSSHGMEGSFKFLVNVFNPEIKCVPKSFSEHLVTELAEKEFIIESHGKYLLFTNSMHPSLKPEASIDLSEFSQDRRPTLYSLDMMIVKNSDLTRCLIYRAEGKWFELEKKEVHEVADGHVFRMRHVEVAIYRLK